MSTRDGLMLISCRQRANHVRDHRDTRHKYMGVGPSFYQLSTRRYNRAQTLYVHLNSGPIRDHRFLHAQTPD